MMSIIISLNIIPALDLMLKNIASFSNNNPHIHFKLSQSSVIKKEKWFYKFQLTCNTMWKSNKISKMNKNGQM